MTVSFPPALKQQLSEKAIPNSCAYHHFLSGVPRNSFPEADCTVLGKKEK